MKQFTKFKMTVLFASLLSLSACTTTNPYTGQKQVSDTAIGTGIGAAGGALAGALLGGEKGALIGGALGAATGSVVGNIFDRENEELRQALEGSGVQVKKEGNSIQLIMASDVTFDTNQSAVRSGFYSTLDSVAVVFKKYNKNSITITGYTDNTGNSAHNQTLSEERAKNVGDYLISRGVPANRIFTTGQGARNPIASNATAAGRAQNRRVVITLRPM